MVRDRLRLGAIMFVLGVNAVSLHRPLRLAGMLGSRTAAGLGSSSLLSSMSAEISYQFGRDVFVGASRNEAADRSRPCLFPEPGEVVEVVPARC
jgi:hypothetical protein